MNVRADSATLDAFVGAAPALGAVPAIEVRGLRLPLPQGEFRVDQWTVAPGECVALIGANGAGKTSLVECLLGLREGARSRSLRLLGHDAAAWRRHPALRARSGVQLQRASLPVWLRVREIVAVHRSLFPRTDAAVHDALGIGPLEDKRYEWLSRGEQQRVDLFMALAHRPELALLDEPFTGLDPRFARECAALLRQLSAVGSTVLMCCHTPDELRLATKVAWIDGGIRRHDTPAGLAHELLGEYRLRLSCASADAARAVADELAPRHPEARWRAVDDRVIAHGPGVLRGLAHALMDRDDVAVEFGATGLDDLLQRCAREA